MRSFTFPQLSATAITDQGIKLPGLGVVKWFKSREIPTGFVAKQARVIRKASGYFVQLSLVSEGSIPEVPFHGHVLGIDLGLDKFLATSDGELIHRPKFLKALQGKLQLLQRRLKHKEQGSNNRHRLNQKIARLHQKIADTRKDFHFKLSHHLCSQAGAIVLEDIDFRSWGRGMFCKHSLDAGFGQFVSILKWVAAKTDTFIAEVDKNFTSQTCPSCGVRTGRKALSERVHHCSECGYTTHRDVAAAQVIRNKGVTGLGHSLVEIASGEVLTGASSHTGLVKPR
jgi:putative transposase